MLLKMLTAEYGAAVFLPVIILEDKEKISASSAV
jgi:hypothetical protein